MSMIENAVRRVVEAMRDDPEFRARMQEDPNAAMAEKGLDELRAHVRVVADTEDIRHFVFPPAPNADLPDGELAAVAGGFDPIEHHRRPHHGWLLHEDRPRHHQLEPQF